MKKLMKKCVAALCTIAMLLPSVPAMPVHAAKDISSNDIYLLQVAGVCDSLPDSLNEYEDAVTKYEALLCDGTQKLVEGKDYTIEKYVVSIDNSEGNPSDDNSSEGLESAGDDFLLGDNDYNIAAIITGIGDYAGERIVYKSDVEYCKVTTYQDWVVHITDTNEGYESCTFAQYNGDEVNVEIPDSISVGGRDYTVEDVLAGCFIDKDKLETVDFDVLEIYPYTFINCPNLTKVTSTLDYPAYTSIEQPGPFVLGELNGELTVEIPFSFSWDYGANDFEKKMSITAYCVKYHYVLLDHSKVYQEDGWNYRISEDAQVAIITSYTGDEESVTVPEKVRFNRKLYYIEDVDNTIFVGLPNLKKIDMGAMPIIDSLCKDCPNLTMITSTSREMDLEGAIVVGEAPAPDTMTVSTYRIAWTKGEGETAEIVDIEDYCREYGYRYKVRLNDQGATNCQIYLSREADEYWPALAGCTMDAWIGFQMEGEDWASSDTELEIAVSNWKSLNEELAMVTEQGQITFSPNAKAGDKVIISATMSIEGVDYAVQTEFSLINRLVPLRTNYRVIIGGEGATLTCSQNIFDEANETIARVSLPEDVEYYFEALSDNVEVSADGVVTAKEGATAGEGLVGLTVNGILDGADQVYNYKTTFNITLVDPEQTPGGQPEDINDQPLVIYGYKKSITAEQVERFKATLPADKRSLVVYKEYEIAYDEEEDYASDYYSAYLTKIDRVMAGDQKADVVLLPGAMLKDCLGKSYIANLEDVGFTDADYAQAYPYTKTRGTLNGKLKAVTWEMNPGCFIYNKSIARAVLGSDNPATVQEALKDWDSFYATGKLCKEKEIPLLSTPDYLNVIAHRGNTMVGDDGTIYLGSVPKDYFDFQEKLYNTGMVNEDTDEWYEAVDLTVLDDNCFGCFADANNVLIDLVENGSYSGFDICQGPVAYEGEYPEYYAVTNNVQNKGLARMFLNSVLNDIEGEGYLPNNQKYVKEMAAYDSKYSQFDSIANAMPNGCFGTKLESKLEDLLSNGYGYDCVVDDGNTTDEMLQMFKDEIKEEIPGTTISMDAKVPETSTDPVKPTNPTNPTDPQPKPQTGSEEHLYSDTWTVDVAATCSKPGSKSKHCKDKGCTAKKDVTVIPATGVHTYGAWVVTKNATCDVAGERTHSCSVCKKVEKEAIPALGFVKGGTFIRGNNNYKIASVKGKKGTVVWTGLVATNKKSVSIPKTVKAGGITFTISEIDANACKGNKSLKKVTIPAGVTKIGANAFNGCSKLKTINVKSTKLKKVGKNAIKGIAKKAQIKVPKKKLKAYKKLFKKKTGFKKTMKVK